jgi:hypothetical protein
VLSFDAFSAKGMSKRLLINYFDCKDISPHHIIHWERPADLSVSTRLALWIEITTSFLKNKGISLAVMSTSITN